MGIVRTGQFPDKGFERQKTQREIGAADGREKRHHTDDIVCIGVVREVFNRQKSLLRTQGYQARYNPYGDIGHTQ